MDDKIYEVSQKIQPKTKKNVVKKQRTPVHNIQHPSNRNSKKRNIINRGQKSINKINEEKFPELEDMDFHVKRIHQASSTSS